MKNIFFTAVLSLLLFSCTNNYEKTITVTNSLDFDRKGEIVEVNVSDLNADFNAKTYILKNSQGEEIGYQLASNGSILIFQADVIANSSAVYKLTEGEPAPVASKTDVFFVPERKDDFAFENDLAAYRMYGPALANENPSNGVDLWLKKVSKPIMKQFYNDEHNNGKSYHVDYGEGLDCYKVGHTLGAGGIAPYINGEIFVGNQYSSHEIVEKGALRSVFTLTYNSVKTENDVYKQTLTITVDAGSTLNKAVVRYEGTGSELTQLATGIYLHDTYAVKGIINSDNHNFITYAEDATSDAGLPAGRNYVGVVTHENSVKMITDANAADPHLFRVSDYNVGDEFIYYFGGGWSEWGYPTDNDWNVAVENFYKKIQSPLSIAVK